MSQHKSTRSTRSSVHQVRKKSPAELNQDITNALIESQQPQLAALFANPQARKTFAKEMRHEMQKQQLARINEAARENRPFTVKRLEQIDDRHIRSLVGNYATEAEARKRADQIDGWVETRDGRVVYGRERAL